MLLLLLPTLLVGGFSFLSLGKDSVPSSPSASADGTSLCPPTVILDPGHGGSDGGAVSVTGTLEKELNLKMANQLSRILTACGVRVILTRSDDRMLDAEVNGSRKMRDLAGRLAIMQTYPDALFISIHMNRYPSPACRGAQVWYAPGREDAKALANAIAEEIRRSVQPDNTRLCKEADTGIFLLYHANSCAVLAECGFLSSPQDAADLEDPLYRDRIAAAMARAILTCLSDLPSHTLE